MENEKEFLKRLLAAFAIEANEHIKAVSQGLESLEKNESGQDSESALEIIFRAMHSLKGAARAVDMRDVESVCQAVENIFASWKKGKSEPDSEQFEILHQTVDALDERLSTGVDNKNEFPDLIEKLNKLVSDDYKELVPDISIDNIPGDNIPGDNISGDNKTKPGEYKAEPLHLFENLQTGIEDLTPPEPEIINKEEEEPAEKENIPVKKKLTGDDSSLPKKKAETETVRISAEKLDALLLQTEEMISAKLAVGEFASDIRQIQALFNQWQNENAKIKNHNRPSQSQLMEFFSWNEEFITNLEQSVKSLNRQARKNQNSLSQMVEILLEDMKKILMLPFSSLTEIFPKMIRSLSGEQGKDVKLSIEGDNIEIDRRVLEQLKDPLIHMIRNSIDHGIETPEMRIAQNKNPCAGINIKMIQVGADKVELEVSDDGLGIDIEKVRSSALKTGIISKTQADTLDMKTACNMIFQSDFTTNSMITDISGRGIGLSIVQENIEKLGGSIEVDSEPGKGICFKMLIPVTLASFRGIFIQVSKQFFLVPTTNVVRVLRIKPEHIKTIENRETISVGGETIPIVSLEHALEMPGKQNYENNSQFIQVLILEYGKERIAFSVTRVINEQEGLVKSLGPQLPRVKAVSGATIYGKGKVAPILNARDLMICAKNVKTSLLETGINNIAGTDLVKSGPARPKSVLVADDSITSRMLIKNILESGGYNVTTAVDGMDAFIILKEKIFDLVVSDVEMPGMDGFLLTEKIRKDNTFANLPVILVTGREHREDKERGIDAGASAYIVKSSFDRDNLLNVVQRLI